MNLDKIIYLKNSRHIRTIRIQKSKRIQFQFVNRSLLDVLPQLQFYHIVYCCEHLKRVYGDWIWNCKTYDNQDIRIGISDFRGNSEHDPRDVVLLCKIFDNLDTYSAIFYVGVRFQRESEDFAWYWKFFDNLDTRSGLFGFRGNSKHDKRDFVLLCNIFDNLNHGLADVRPPS